MQIKKLEILKPITGKEEISFFTIYPWKLPEYILPSIMNPKFDFGLMLIGFGFTDEIPFEKRVHVIWSYSSIIWNAMFF